MAVSDVYSHSFEDEPAEQVACHLQVIDCDDLFVQHLFYPLWPLDPPDRGGELFIVADICNPYDIKFNNGYYLLISYIIRVSSRLLIGLVLTAIVFLDSKVSNINNFPYQYSIFLLNTRRRNEHSNGYHLLVADAVKIFNIVY